MSDTSSGHFSSFKSTLEFILSLCFQMSTVAQNFRSSLRSPVCLISLTQNFGMRSHLWNDSPGKISIFAMSAARFNATIPLIDKHVTVSLLAKQLAITLRNVVESSALITPGAATANAKTLDNITNTFILNQFSLIISISCIHAKARL